jgi:inosose dehydratase
LRAALEPYGLARVSGGFSGRLARRSADEEIGGAGAHLTLLAEGGANVMVYGEVADSIQGASVPLYKRPRFTSAGQWRDYGRRVTQFARYTLDHGVRLAYHHHMGAYVETPDDVDRLIENSGDEVGLLFDSGHMTFAGGDAVAMLAKHAVRVCHVHCKDVRPAVIRLARNRDWSFLEAVINGAFTVPGDGAVDFASLIDILRRNDYRGWLVVEAEQDPVVAPAYRYAEMGYRHLSALVNGVH